VGKVINLSDFKDHVDEVDDKVRLIQKILKADNFIVIFGRDDEDGNLDHAGYLRKCSEIELGYFSKVLDEVFSSVYNDFEGGE